MAKKNAGKKVGIGVGIGALAAAAAGAYYFYGTKEGAKKRKKITSWMLKMKGEVLAELEKLENVSEKKYHQIVDAAVKKYSKMKHIDKKELMALKADMKKHWKNIKKQIDSKPKKKAPAKKKKAPAKKKKTTKRKTTSKKRKR
jgi:CRISPR/Cas system CSM-associated protein Csm4 (group 5 of RAMP superfamily)